MQTTPEPQPLFIAVGEAVEGVKKIINKLKEKFLT